MPISVRSQAKKYRLNNGLIRVCNEDNPRNANFNFYYPQLIHKQALSAVVSDDPTNLSPSPASSYRSPKLHPIAHAPKPNHVLNGRQFAGLSETTAKPPAPPHSPCPKANHVLNGRQFAGLSETTAKPPAPPIAIPKAQSCT